ncbi:hypothetical protein AB0L71_04365 [Streptomyces sp. NPDC052052]|uniref:hypothetical protein n=1 Tax=Streptomyces sp. NPDC052052 TaxID=3154756 RepID=UPI00343FF1E7
MSRVACTSGNARLVLRTATAALSTLTFLVCGTPTAHTACLGGPHSTQAGGRPSRAPHLEPRQQSGTSQQASHRRLEAGSSRSFAPAAPQ